MRTNTTLAALRAGRPAYGTWLQLHSYPVTRLLAAQGGFDWLLVDFEHSPIDAENAAILLSTITDASEGRVTPIARVAAGTLDQIKRVLDAGAQGVLVPMVNTAAEAQAAVRAARFPPEGVRGAGGIHPHVGFGVNRPEYQRIANEQVLVAIQIETAEAVANLASILEVDGLDVVFIGPADLHLSLGFPAKSWSSEPAFLEAVDRIRKGCEAARLPLGTLVRDAAEAKARVSEGFTFVGIGGDVRFLLSEAGRQAAAVRDLPDPAGGWSDARFAPRGR